MASASGGHACVVERAAYPLNRGRVDPEPLGDLPHARASWLRQRGPYGVFRGLCGPAQPDVMAIRRWLISCLDPSACSPGNSARSDSWAMVRSSGARTLPIPEDPVQPLT